MNTFQNLLKSYQKKLTNLTWNNRSLLLLKLVQDSFIDIKNFEFSTQNQSTFQFLESVIKRCKTTIICSFSDGRDTISNELSKKLNKIKRKDTFIIEENGSKNLVIGYPIVEGKFNDGTIVRAPILLFPIELKVEIIKNKPTWVVSIIEDEFPFINRSFLLAYSYYNNVILDEQLYEYTFEDDFEDTLSFKNTLYQTLKNSKIDINFNSENFTNKIEYFLDKSSTDIEESYKNGELKMLPQAVMGIFQESNSVINQDYEQLISENKFETLEHFFESKSQKNKVIKEENLLTTFDIDASQEYALKEVKSGKSIVVQGPPGTGKSQLICNLITDFIANRKKVLVVCQKRVALDVVYKRLKTKHLENFIGLVHDYKFDRKYFFEQISNQIESIENYQNTNNSLDAIWLEKEYLVISRKIEQIVSELDLFKLALFDESKFGISAKNLYLDSNFSDNYKSNIEFYKNLNIQTLNQFIDKISLLIPYAEIIEKNNFLFKKRISFSKYTSADKNKIIDVIDEIIKTENEGFFEHKYLTKRINYSEFIHVKNQKENCIKILQFIDNESNFDIFKYIYENKIEYLEIKKQFTNYEKYISKNDFEKTLKRTEVKNAHLIINNTIQQWNRFLGSTIWKIKSKEKKYVEELLYNNNLKINYNNLKIIKEKIENRLRTDEKLDKIAQKINLKIDESILDKEKLDDIIKEVENAYEVLKIFNEIKSNFTFKNKIDLNKNELTDFLNQFINTSEIIDNKHNKINTYFTKENIIEIIDNQENKSEYISQIRQNFEHIVAYDTLINQLSLSEKNVYLLYISSIEFNEISDTIKNDAYNTWIEILENNSPILKSCSTFELQNLEDELQKLIISKQEISSQILLLKLRELTYKNLEFNRLNNRITYRELKHQTTKKRKIWSVRKLFEQQSNEILQLIPCWLASPETVSAIFPAHEIFDLVIFDEASQCFAEKGLAAMIRGKQICVVGDDKQLAPNNLYHSRYEDDENENSDSEIDSLLNISEKYLPQTMLTSHFRSKYYDLIKFSNETFYKNKLTFIPEFKDTLEEKNCIEYIKLNGIWQNNTNKIEAEYIVNLCFELFNKNPTKNIGIITFNIKQQQLIEEKLYDSANEKKWNVPNSLFVKNIENVQGDERDIIIFSIAYAPDKYNQMNMQFGSLNMLNGENRLNVALTRAKEKIYLITSILPHQMEVEKTLNFGPKLLKKYLEYAYHLNQNSKKIEINKNKNNTNYLKNKLIANKKDISHFEYQFADAKTENRLILTDDNLFFQSVSSKDFFGYKSLYLKHKNWKFERIFSRNFWLNK